VPRQIKPRTAINSTESTTSVKLRRSSSKTDLTGAKGGSGNNQQQRRNSLTASPAESSGFLAKVTCWQQRIDPDSEVNLNKSRKQRPASIAGVENVKGGGSLKRVPSLGALQVLDVPCTPPYSQHANLHTLPTTQRFFPCPCFFCYFQLQPFCSLGHTPILVPPCAFIMRLCVCVCVCVCVFCLMTQHKAKAYPKRYRYRYIYTVFMWQRRRWDIFKSWIHCFSYSKNSTGTFKINQNPDQSKSGSATLTLNHAILLKGWPHENFI
jgi:hypothetical protein